jgi:hypothetical protein
MIVSLTGLVVSFFAYLIAFPDRERRRFDIYLALLVLHLLMTVAYWLYHFEAAMDAFGYYRDPYGFYQMNPFASGTYFIVHVVQTIKGLFGGSFLDHFLFFQCFGMIGFALLIRSFNEVAESLGVEVPLFLYFLLFLPGPHFWSVAIGKDGPVFMAVALAAWASMNIQKRYLWFGVAILVMAAIRPHVAAIAMGAACLSFLIARGVSPAVRVLMVPVGLVGLIVTLGRAEQMLGISLSSAESMSDFVQYQQGLNTDFGSSNNLANLSFPLKVISLLFRPLFFDTRGMMGLVASVENSILLFIFGYIVYHWRDVLRLIGRVYYVTFCAIFSSALIVALSLVNYNLGLGQRQKMMVMPAILLIYATVYLYRKYLASVAGNLPQEAPEAPALTTAEA